MKQLPQYIIIDSTVLINDINRRGNDLRLLLAAATRERFQLVVPEIVIRETLRKFDTSRQQAELQYVRAFKEFQKLVPAKVKAEEVFAEEHDARKSFKQHLLHDLNFAGADMPEPPDVKHSEIIDRIMEGRNPSGSNKDSYRDILIWLSVMEYASTGTVGFVTTDSDFSDDDRLANDLIEDLATRGIPAENVTLYRGLRSFLDEFIVPDAKVLGALMDRHQTDRQFSSRVNGAVKTAVFRDLPLGTPVGFLQGPYADLVGWVLTNMSDDILALDFDDVRSIGEKEALVELRCYINVSLELAPREDWWKAPRISPRLNSRDDRDIDPPPSIDEAVLLVILEGKLEDESVVTDLQVTRHWGLEQFP